MHLKDTMRADERGCEEKSGASRYRFLLMPPYRLPPDSKWGYQTVSAPIGLPKEQRLKNYELVESCLEDVDWDLHPGAEPLYGD